MTFIIKLFMLFHLVAMVLAGSSPVITLFNIVAMLSDGLIFLLLRGLLNIK